MSSNKSPNALRTIGEVAEDIGVATHVLRFWESKFNQIKPQKRRGRRYYRPEDIKTITQIKALLYNQGYTIRGVQKFLMEESKNKSARKNTLANMINEEKVAVENTTKPTEPDFDKFKTDLFGNIVPENDIKIEAAIQDSEPSKKQSNYSEQEIIHLRNIYNHMITARDALNNI